MVLRAVDECGERRWQWRACPDEEVVVGRLERASALSAREIRSSGATDSMLADVAIWPRTV